MVSFIDVGNSRDTAGLGWTSRASGRNVVFASLIECVHGPEGCR